MNKINEKDRLIGGPFLTSLLLFLVFDTVYAYGHTLLMNSSIVFFSKTKIMLANIVWHCVVFLICVWIYKSHEENRTINRNCHHRYNYLYSGSLYTTLSCCRDNSFLYSSGYGNCLNAQHLFFRHSM